MDLSKSFDCPLHDLLNAKLEAYGCDTKTLNIFRFYVNQRKDDILSGVPQGSMLGRCQGPYYSTFF